MYIYSKNETKLKNTRSLLATGGSVEHMLLAALEKTEGYFLGTKIMQMCKASEVFGRWTHTHRLVKRE
jgi:hypothetical protein